jgi:hypothetical protein
MNFPVFSHLAGNWGSETGSLETASSSGESGANPTHSMLTAGLGLPYALRRR